LPAFTQEQLLQRPVLFHLQHAIHFYNSVGLNPVFGRALGAAIQHWNFWFTPLHFLTECRK